MRIGIDARMFGLKHAGIGRYVENLVKNILKLDKKNEYTLFVRKNQYESIRCQVPGAKLVIAETRHYSLKEQFLIPYLLFKEKLDLVHFPHFNVPLICPTKFVVTIHDLLWHEMKGNEVTTLSSPVYTLKYQGYKAVFSHAVKEAAKIFVPTNWVKNKLLTTYSLNKDKIIVTYEGVDQKYFKKTQNLSDKYKIKKPYLIYTGSAYPHKNLNFLIEVIKTINQGSDEKMQLVIACARDVFWKKLAQKIKEEKLEPEVKLLGFVSDEDLLLLYQNASAFVFPSLSEGFGLPGLEAMAAGLPVISARTGALKEVYQDAALFFDPQQPDELIQQIRQVRAEKIREGLRKKGLALVKKYSIEKMATQTLKTYQSVLG